MTVRRRTAFARKIKKAAKGGLRTFPIAGAGHHTGSELFSLSQPAAGMVTPHVKMPCWCERMLWIDGMPTNRGAIMASKATATIADTSVILRDTIGYPEYVATILD